jgi:ferredoxin--NADP+ reductase
MSNEFLRATVRRRVDWAEGLMTLALDPVVEPYQAGQFVEVGLEVDGAPLTRSYSLASAPGAEHELYLTRVDQGALTPRLFALRPGDELLVSPHAAGIFTLQRVPDAEVLWLLSTGTGLGPTIAMLRTEAPWQRFGRVVVAHGVREAAHLGYRAELSALAASRSLTYLPFVSREQGDSDCIPGRITTALRSGELEARVGAVISAERSQVMLCGNPEMVNEVKQLLSERGLARNTPRKPGQLTTEAYW